MVALDVVRVVVLLRVVDVVRMVVLHLVVWLLYVEASHYQIDSECTQCKISELRRLAFYTKGKFTDIGRKDDCNPVSFVEYAYAVKTTQPNAPRNFQEGMKTSDADLWRKAAEKEIKSLRDLDV